MTKKMKMTLLSLVSVVAIAAPMTLAISCGEGASFEFKPASSASSTAITPDSIRVVTNGEPINDMSFNQQAWEALVKIRTDENGTPANPVKDSIKPTPYGDTNKIIEAYRNFAQDDSVSTILAPGFAQVDPMKKFITDYDNALNFIVVDGEVPGPNVASIIFKTDQAAFLAGNLAAHYLVDVKNDPDPKVGMFGGGPFPGVTDFMKGFVEGIAYYNANNENGRDITFAKFDTDSAYTNTGFAPHGGTSAAQRLIRDGADVILPVAGPQTADVIAVINDSNSDAKIIGVDTDSAVMYGTDSTKNPLFLTSIMKEISTAFVNVYKAIDTKQGNEVGTSFKGLGETTIGDLENQLVSIAEPSFNEESSLDSNITIDSIYSDIKSDTTLLDAAKATPKFSTWNQALAYVKDGNNPYSN